MDLKSICDETPASGRCLSWLNRVIAVICNVIFTLERVFYIATETVIAVEMVLLEIGVYV